MSVKEREALDFALLMDKTGELAEALLRSSELADYLYWKGRMEQDPDVLKFRMRMAKARERFEECERFGHYHPNYHEALDAVKALEAELESVEAAREFKRAEKALDVLLYDVSVTIAHAVSDTVKVPGNDPEPKHGSSCGSGGSCGCGG